MNLQLSTIPVEEFFWEPRETYPVILTARDKSHISPSLVCHAHLWLIFLLFCGRRSIKSYRGKLSSASIYPLPDPTITSEVPGIQLRFHSLHPPLPSIPHHEHRIFDQSLRNVSNISRPSILLSFQCFSLSSFFLLLLPSLVVSFPFHILISLKCSRPVALSLFCLLPSLLLLLFSKMTTISARLLITEKDDRFALHSYSYFTPLNGSAYSHKVVLLESSC